MNSWLSGHGGFADTACTSLSVAYCRNALRSEVSGMHNNVRNVAISVVSVGTSDEMIVWNLFVFKLP